MSAGVWASPYLAPGHPAHGLATKLDAAADRLIRTASIPDNDLPYTVMLWVKINTDPNTFAAIWSINSSSSVDDTLLCNDDGTTFALGVSGTVSVGGVNATVGKWYHLAMVRESTTALKLYVNGTLQATGTTSVARATPTRFEIGALTSSNTIPFGGSVYNPKAWRLVGLNAGEVIREMNSHPPVSQLHSLYGWWPGPPGAPHLDYSGKRNHFTIAGTLTHDAPPQLWRPSLYLPAWLEEAGGDTFTGTAAITLPALTAEGSGTFTAPVYTGSAAITLPALTASGTGAHSAHGTAASTLPAMTASGTGTHTAPTYDGSAALTLPVISAEGTGTFTAPVYTGTAAVNLPALTAAGTGTHTAPTYTGSATITLPAITASGAGTFSSEYLGAGAATLPIVTASGTGTHTAPTYTGSATITLPVLAAAGSGTFTAPTATGSATLSLPVLTASGSGTYSAFVPPVFASARIGGGGAPLAQVGGGSAGQATAGGGGSGTARAGGGGVARAR